MNFDCCAFGQDSSQKSCAAVCVCVCGRCADTRFLSTLLVVGDGWILTSEYRRSPGGRANSDSMNDKVLCEPSSSNPIPFTDSPSLDGVSEAQRPQSTLGSLPTTTHSQDERRMMIRLGILPKGPLDLCLRWRLTDNDDRTPDPSGPCPYNERRRA